MKLFFIPISLILALVLAGCTELETESQMNADKSLASPSGPEKIKSDKVIEEANDSVKQQHLSGAASSISEDKSGPKPHVSGSATPAQSTHISGQ